MADPIDGREAKALADMLAMVLEDNEHVAATALDKLRRRARQQRVSGAAVKTLLGRLAAGERGGTSPAGGWSAGREAGDLEHLSAAVRALEARNRELAAELARQRYAALQAAPKRGLWIAGALCLTLLGGGTGWLAGAASNPGPGETATPLVPAAPRPGASADPPATPDAAAVGWSRVTPRGVRWRVLEGGAAPTVLIDLGYGQIAQVNVPSDFLQLAPAEAGREVERIQGDILAHFAGQAGQYDYLGPGRIAPSS